MSRKSTTGLLSTLRALMGNVAHVPKPLDAYIVPSEDAHQSEYTADCDQRRAFISGFTGSMGTAVITTSSAALWTDARYYIQAEQELDDNWILMKQGVKTTPKVSKWLLEQFKGPKKNCHVGVDPMLYSCQQWKDLSKVLTEAGHELVAVEQNLIDLVWADDRPARPSSAITILEERWTGKSHIEKLKTLRSKIKEESTAIVLTALDDVAYLLNLRGTDIEYNPVFFSYVIVTLEKAFLFVDPVKVPEAVGQYLQDAGVTIMPYDQLIPQLKTLCGELKKDEKVWLPNRCSHAVKNAVPLKQQYSACTPVTLAKAIKNDTEIKGMEASHIRDGAAMCSFLTWLEVEAPKGTQTELTAADYLQKCRERQDHFKGLSFETISSVGSNAAIVHYKPAPATDKVITDTEVYLVDSGGHYSDGTTDVTRTLHFGQPTAEEKDAYTRVLKGHIALAAAVFPKNTKGHCLDTFARQFLWNAGLNYGHGTGHGVGMYLNVHEGPMGISWRAYPDDPGLQEGMFLSDEPGYYETDKFGIRIESIVRVVEANTPHRIEERQFLTFKPTTLVPIQTSLIDLSQLTKQEVNWLNSYHDVVREEVGKLLQEQEDIQAYDWLIKETQHIKCIS